MDNSGAQNWIEDFTRRFGRAPRILHVGNVAGNAYQIAKVLNAAGADCDVLSADYYYTMGSPEWEDADFSGDVGNSSYPAWYRANLHGFERPRWYAAAPRRLAIAYLVAKRQGNEKLANRLWRWMGRSRNYYAYRERSRLKRLWLLLEKCAYAFLAFLRRLAPAAKSTAHAPPQNTGLPPCVSRVMADAKELFPGQTFHLDTEWNSDYTLDAVPLYANLFSHYDIIQGYATDVAWPYLAGVENYIGFEHGTIRDLPHADTDNKRLALLGYARGKALYVTNIDSLGAAQFITQRSGTPIVCGLHGIGIQRLLDKMELAKHAKKDGRFGVPDGTPVFLCPSRHDFLPDEGVFLKGDDVYLPAAARLAREGQDFVLVLVNWGADVEKTRAIIHSYPELKEHIRWTQPLGKTELYLAFCQVDAVLDQLYAPVFGGIAIEVLSAAHSLLIAHKVDEDLCRDFFGQPLPYWPCAGQGDIYDGMKHVITQPQKALALAKEGRAWIENCHSPQRLLEKCLEAYACCPVASFESALFGGND